MANNIIKINDPVIKKRFLDLAISQQWFTPTDFTSGFMVQIKQLRMEKNGDFNMGYEVVVIEPKAAIYHFSFDDIDSQQLDMYLKGYDIDGRSIHLWSSYTERYC